MWCLSWILRWFMSSHYFFYDQGSSKFALPKCYQLEVFFQDFAIMFPFKYQQKSSHKSIICPSNFMMMLEIYIPLPQKPTCFLLENKHIIVFFFLGRMWVMAIPRMVSLTAVVDLVIQRGRSSRCQGGRATVTSYPHNSLPNTFSKSWEDDFPIGFFLMLPGRREDVYWCGVFRIENWSIFSVEPKKNSTTAFLFESVGYCWWKKSCTSW